MTVRAWPPELPRPTRADYAAQLADPRQRRAAETGPRGYRRRFSAVPEMVALAMDVSRRQRAIFETFHRQTCAMGALPFTMVDPTTDGWPLLSADGQPLLSNGVPILLSATWLCQFGDAMPTITVRAGVTFRVTFTVEVMP